MSNKSWFSPLYSQYDIIYEPKICSMTCSYLDSLENSIMVSSNLPKSHSACLNMRRFWQSVIENTFSMVVICLRINSLVGSCSVKFSIALLTLVLISNSRPIVFSLKSENMIFCSSVIFLSSPMIIRWLWHSSTK